MALELEWTGKSGTKYKYWEYALGGDKRPSERFDAKPGNYIMVRKEVASYTTIYVGQTGDLSERFLDHHKALCFQTQAATHIHAHTSSSDEATRLREEADLVRAHRPICQGH